MLFDTNIFLIIMAILALIFAAHGPAKDLYNLFKKGGKKIKNK